MKCFVKGCENHYGEGGFMPEAGICIPCFIMLSEGEIGHGHTFIHDLRDELHVAATLVERAHNGLHLKDDA